LSWQYNDEMFNKAISQDNNIISVISLNNIIWRDLDKLMLKTMQRMLKLDVANNFLSKTLKPTTLTAIAAIHLQQIALT